MFASCLLLNCMLISFLPCFVYLLICLLAYLFSYLTCLLIFLLHYLGHFKHLYYKFKISSIECWRDLLETSQLLSLVRILLKIDWYPFQYAIPVPSCIVHRRHHILIKSTASWGVTSKPSVLPIISGGPKGIGLIIMLLINIITH